MLQSIWRIGTRARALVLDRAEVTVRTTSTPATIYLPLLVGFLLSRTTWQGTTHRIQEIGLLVFVPATPLLLAQVTHIVSLVLGAPPVSMSTTGVQVTPIVAQVTSVRTVHVLLQNQVAQIMTLGILILQLTAPSF